MTLTPFWHGVLVSSCAWMILLNLSLWYWRRKINELRDLLKKVNRYYSAEVTRLEANSAVTAISETHVPDESALKEAFHQVWISHEDGGHEMEWEQHWRASREMEKSRPYVYSQTIYPKLMLEAARKLKEAA